MSDVLIKVENLSKKFCRNLKKSLWYGVKDIAKDITGQEDLLEELRPDEFWSLKNVSFELKRGESLGLIGPNGAGKSTLLKLFTGLIKPDRGRITMRGRVGALIELGAGFNPILTGKENIYINGAVLGFTKDEINKKLDSIIDFSELEDFLETPVQNYSSGMKVRLGFAIAAQMEPDILLIDEVLAVGDLGFRSKCFNTINRIMKNSAVIFVSHSMPEVNRVCSDICVLNKGLATYQGKDVPTGIDMYFSTFETEKHQIVGSGRAKVHSIVLESNGLRDIASINYLDELTVHFEVSVDPSINNPCLGVTFLNQALQIVAQCHSHYNRHTIINNGKRMRISMALGPINLNPGTYTISMGIQEENVGEVLVRHLNFTTLKVKGHFFGQAPTQIKGLWTVQNVD